MLKRPTGPDFLLKIIPNYSELSGFVHGGPSTADVLHQFSGENVLDVKLLQIASVVIRMRYSAKRWVLEFAATGMKDFEKPRDEFEAALKEFDQVADAEWAD